MNFPLMSVLEVESWVADWQGKFVQMYMYTNEEWNISWIILQFLRIMKEETPLLKPN